MADKDKKEKAEKQTAFQVKRAFRFKGTEYKVGSTIEIADNEGYEATVKEFQSKKYI